MKAVRVLVLTDLVDSTALVERLGVDATTEMMGAVDRAVRRLIETHNGQEIDKTDGFLLLFTRVPEAVSFCIDLHVALHRLREETGHPIAMRAGMHQGEVTLRRNHPDDVARGAKPVEVEGLAKPMAARIMSLAGGDQTLASESTARDAAMGGHAWHDCGRYRLKGVTEPVRLMELAGAGQAPVGPPGDTEKAWRALSGPAAVQREQLRRAWTRPSVRVVIALSALLMLTAATLTGLWRWDQTRTKVTYADVLDSRFGVPVALHTLDEETARSRLRSWRLEHVGGRLQRLRRVNHLLNVVPVVIEADVDYILHFGTCGDEGACVVGADLSYGEDGRIAAWHLVGRDSSLVQRRLYTWEDARTLRHTSYDSQGNADRIPATLWSEDRRHISVRCHLRDDGGCARLDYVDASGMVADRNAWAYAWVDGALEERRIRPDGSLLVEGEEPPIRLIRREETPDGAMLTTHEALDGERGPALFEGCERQEILEGEDFVETRCVGGTINSVEPYYGPPWAVGQPPFMADCVSWRVVRTGPSTLRRTCYDADGTVIPDRVGVAIYDIALDEGGHPVRLRFYDQQEQPTVRLGGLAEMTFENDAYGRQTEVRYLDGQGAPLPWHEGVAGWRYGYLEDKRTDVTALDVAGQPTWTTPRSCRSHQELSSELNRPRCQPGCARTIEGVRPGVRGRETRCLGPGGEPSLNAWGYHRIFSVRDGMKSERRYFGVDGRPTETPGQGHLVRYEDDVHGNTAVKAYFDAQERPMLGGDGYHRQERDAEGMHWTEVRYYDRAGDLVANGHGCAVSQRELDDQMNEVQRRCLDAERKPALCGHGFYDARTTRDEAGRRTALVRWAPDGSVLLSAGCERVRFAYNEEGHLSRESCETLDGTATPRPMWGSGTQITLERDAEGRLLAQTYLDEDGQPVDGREGYARFTLAYDAAGRTIEERVFRADGSAFVFPGDGHSGIARAYDERGRQTELVLLGPDGAPRGEGLVRIETRYDSRGRVAERLQWGPDQTVRARDVLHWSDQDQLLRASATSENGEPHSLEEAPGANELERAYDANGWQVTELRRDAEGQPALAGDIAGWRAVRESTGRVTEVTLLDIDGQPAVHAEALQLFDEEVTVPAHVARVALTYHDQQHVRRQYFYDADGAPTAGTLGCEVLHHPIIDGEQGEPRCAAG